MNFRKNYSFFFFYSLIVYVSVYLSMHLSNCFFKHSMIFVCTLRNSCIYMLFICIILLEDYLNITEKSRCNLLSLVLNLL